MKNLLILMLCFASTVWGQGVKPQTYELHFSKDGEILKALSHAEGAIRQSGFPTVLKTNDKILIYLDLSKDSTEYQKKAAKWKKNNTNNTVAIPPLPFDTVTLIVKPASAFEVSHQQRSNLWEYRLTKNVDSLTISLKKQLRSEMAIAKHLNKHQNSIKTWEEYVPLILRINEFYADNMTAINEQMSLNILYGTDSTKQLDKLLQPFNNYYDSLVTVIKFIWTKNETWRKANIWMLDKPTDLNPFEIAEPNNYARFVDKLKVGYANLDSLKNDFKGYTDSYNSKIKQLNTSETLLYAGKFYGANADKIYWMRHYEAIQRQWANLQNHPPPQYTSEQDRTAIIVHNLRRKEKDSIKLGTEEAIIIKSPSEKYFSEIAANLTTEKSNTDIGKLLDFMFPLGSNLWSQMIQADRNLSKVDTSACEIYLKSVELLKWLNEQTIKMPIFPVFQPKPDTLSPSFRSVAYVPDDKVSDLGNKKLPYSVLIDDKAVLEGKVQKYKLTYLVPTLGIVYITEPRISFQYNATTQSFNPVDNLDQLDAIGGIKYYPFGMNISSTRKDKKAAKLESGKQYGWKRGNTILNHSFLTFGLSVRQSTFKNYFLGIGTDIVPGVAVLGGVNFYTRKRYELVNGSKQSESESFTAKFYTGISFDLVLASTLVKLLIK